jgi:hypothetical protein
MNDLASWANEVDLSLRCCRKGVFHRQKKLPAFLTKFFQGVMFDITLRANDHFSLLKSSSAYGGDDGVGRGGTPNSRTESCQRWISRASADFAYGRRIDRSLGVGGNGFLRPRLRAEAYFGAQARAPFPQPIEGVLMHFVCHRMNKI